MKRTLAGIGVACLALAGCGGGHSAAWNRGLRAGHDDLWLDGKAPTTKNCTDAWVTLVAGHIIDSNVDSPGSKDEEADWIDGCRHASPVDGRVLKTPLP